jgi:glycosyltransferase involved in cell wall biosynthesis
MKKSTATIICHSFPSWDAPYVKSTIEILKPLSRDFRVVFLDYAYTWKDVFFNKHAPVFRILGLKARKRHIQVYEDTEIEVISLPPLLPSPPGLKKLTDKLNKQMLKWFFRSIISKEELDNQYYINALNPKWGFHLRDLFNPVKTIYYCYDHIGDMDWAAGQMAEFETPFAATVDQVVCSSTALKRKFEEVNDNVLVINNGFDHTKFEAGVYKTGETHIISYLGAIDKRLDYPLIEKMLIKYPAYIFRFIGPVKSPEIENLDKLYANLEITGALSQSQAADLVKESSACIIPFLKTDFTRYIYPLKINEYLALGKAVVSSDFSVDVAAFDDCIYRCETHKDFLHSLCISVNSNKPETIKSRIQKASGNSWIQRARQFSLQIA